MCRRALVSSALHRAAGARPPHLQRQRHERVGVLELGLEEDGARVGLDHKGHGATAGLQVDGHSSSSRKGKAGGARMGQTAGGRGADGPYSLLLGPVGTIIIRVLLALLEEVHRSSVAVTCLDRDRRRPARPGRPLALNSSPHYTLNVWFRTERAAVGVVQRMRLVPASSVEWALWMARAHLLLAAAVAAHHPEVNGCQHRLRVLPQVGGGLPQGGGGGGGSKGQGGGALERGGEGHGRQWQRPPPVATGEDPWVGAGGCCWWPVGAGAPPAVPLHLLAGSSAAARHSAVA